MATNLYETLGINRNASPEEIRKAYRRKALETHPDRLPHGASAAEKSASEDMFRKVNNAYEVLSDPQNRAQYDEQGVWPPPAPAPQGPFANGIHDPFSDPFFRDPFPFSRGPRVDPFGGFGFGPRPSARAFTDPFVLFDSIFGNLHRALEVDPFFDTQYGRRSFGSSSFSRGFFDNAFPSLPPLFDFTGGGMGSSRMQTFSNSGNGGRWVSESWSSSTVNGATHTKCVRKDSEGNEHVTYRYPDGTERRTVNGIEQSSLPPRALPPSAPPALPLISYPTQSTNIPPPTYSEAVGPAPPRSRASRQHGHHYSDHPDDRYMYRHRHGHDHKERDRGRDYEVGRDSYGYRDDGRGHNTQGNPSWKSWRA